MILADTDVLIDYLAAAQPIADEIAAHIRSDHLLTSAITCFELLSGAREGRRGDAVRRLVMAIPVVPLDREAATQAAKVRQVLAASGFIVGMADCLIAGIAMVNDLSLLTRNRKHYERVVGLRLAR